MKSVLEGKPIRHPLHPLLVHFPIGFFALSFLLDLADLLTENYAGLPRASFICILFGLGTGLLAAVPGFVDFTDIRRDHPAKRIAIWHMGLNLTVIFVYAINAGIRYADLPAPQVGMAPFLLSAVGVGILCVSGYLGGLMIFDHGVAVGRHLRRAKTPERTVRFSLNGAAQPSESPGDRIISVARLDQLQEGESLRVQLEDFVLAVIKSGGQVYAIQEFCTHRFGPLSEGRYDKETVECPWHGSCFNLRTGQVIHGPAKEPIKTFPVEVRDGNILVSVPYIPAKRREETMAKTSDRTSPPETQRTTDTLKTDRETPRSERRNPFS